MYILGINAAYHESSVCLLNDDHILFMAEEERFNRIKHGKKPRPENPDELPEQALQACFDAATITIRDIERIGYSFDPYKASLWKDLPMITGDIWWGAEEDTRFVKNMSLLPETFRAMGFTGEFHWIDHHAAHAASAYYASPFTEAAVLSIDGTGESNTTGFFTGTQHRVEQIQEILCPHSLGFLWELFSLFLGFDIYDAYKAMGLASYGDPTRYIDHFRELIHLTSEGRFELNDAILQLGALNYAVPCGYYQGLETLFDLPKRNNAHDELTQAHTDIAAALQRVTNEAVLHAVNYLYERVDSENLCLAGGVALNCVANRHVFEEGPFRQFYVQPASHDAGTAVGAALYIRHHLQEHPAPTEMSHAYWGPEFSASEIERALCGLGISYRRSPNIEYEAAHLISQGRVIGFFQGRMEVGPRALGNRSLLADPRNPNMREILNQKVKHREYFRPFAPSILYEEVHNWFHIRKDTSAMEFMLMTYPAREENKHKIPAVVHIDGTSRIQAVRKEVNPRYHRLISEFFTLTGVPVVLNTSFNDSEPIVCTPHDAITTFLKTEIDYLAIGDFLASKSR